LWAGTIARSKRFIQFHRSPAAFSRLRRGSACRRSGDDDLSIRHDRQLHNPLWIAKNAGFFKPQGLDVKIVFVEGSPRTMLTLIATLPDRPH